MQCPTCQGQGVIQAPNGTVQRCPMCEGTGRDFDPGLEFTYELGPVVIANANAAVNGQSVQILDFPFKWMFAIATSTGAFSAFIRDGKNKRPFMNQAIHSSNFFGTAQSPMPLLTPFVFEKRGSILVDLADLSGVNGNSIRIAFRGVELTKQ
jgi:hypothetical protein